MSRTEQRAVTRCLTLKNLSVSEITIELQSIYGTDALRDSTVSKWRPHFQDGSDDLCDLARSGRPSRSGRTFPRASPDTRAKSTK
jgi:transposase